MKFKEFLLLEKEKADLDLNLDPSKDEEKDPAAEEPAEEDPPAEDTPPEEPVDETPSSFKDLFDQNTDKVKTFARTELFDAKELTGEEVFKVQGKTLNIKKGQYLLRNRNDVKKLKIVSASTYKSDYETVRASAKPDAEGFIMVRPSGEVEAFEYDGDSLTLENQDKDKIVIKKGMMVLRYENEEESGWTMSKNEFKNTYK